VRRGGTRPHRGDPAPRLRTHPLTRFAAARQAVSMNSRPPLRSVAEGPAHRQVFCQAQRVVMGVLDPVDRVTEITRHALERARDLGQVEPIRGSPRAYRHRSVALHAEVSDVRLALATRIHGEKQRVVRGIRMHARCPLLVVLWVAPRARQRVHQLLARQGRGRRAPPTLRARAHGRHSGQRDQLEKGPEPARPAPLGAPPSILCPIR
jgi:hypothetical protein